MLIELPELLNSLPSSIQRIIVHVGLNNTARQQSELSKEDFKDIFKLLNSLDKSVFISGPIPTLAREVGRFSRILNIHTWLQSAYSVANTGFIDNFNLF